MQRYVAGEAIGDESGMSGRERARTDHEVGVGEDERPQPEQIGRNQRQGPAALHFQLQNNATAMIWARARTENARVIG